jgi:hypothetical protein
VALRKWPLTPDQVTELEASDVRPEWAHALISEVERAAGLITKAAVSVPALYFGVHRTLRALFGDSDHLAMAAAVAAEFAHLWPRYSAGGAFVTIFRRRRQ